MGDEGLRDCHSRPKYGNTPEEKIKVEMNRLDRENKRLEAGNRKKRSLTQVRQQN